MYQQVATMVYEQYRGEGKANPAKIISSFMDEEEQKEVAGLFNARIHEVESETDMEKALKETILRVKQNSINYRSEHTDPTDLSAMMRTIEDRKALQQLEKLHISIN
jgi:DNA primase